MNFSQAIRTVLSKYATFSGRAARSEYWWWVLFVVIVSVVAQILDGVLFPATFADPDFVDYTWQPISSLVGLALLLPNISVGVRRLHDLGRTGWWLFLALIPLIGFLVLLYWFVQPGDEKQNQFG